ncbi:Na+/H+ antiporter NhaA [Rhodoferax sp.]|uniref:Na+/H+ antiporter NhaA n=1 Tax=Rhodoferax sp. TaxID=50421 RepID=UPI00260A4FC6|nr:Na+/H+ antiporter NhaA [Rhodoferax sp.]MDD5478790.1 Na+/H+ antiporter NhaA [Rhodoferax sp.]
MIKKLLSNVTPFINSQTLGGVMLAVAAMLALLLSNSAWRGGYEQLLQFPVALRFGVDALVLAKPMLIWINDLWMAVFFFLVGLEIKRELIDGELASFRQVLLPAVAALGGMVVPALIFATINSADPVALQGWGIPMATDIAFALGILVLLGSRVPVSLKIFLTAVAIIDDLGAILVIAFFYTANLSLPMLLAGAAGVGVLFTLNRWRVVAIGPYVVVGLVIWVCVLKSGIHATLAGVITALAIPMTDGKGGSPLQTAEHALHPWVAYLVLPVFAFANAGVYLGDATLGSLLKSVPLGIAAGLLLGKPLGVLGAAWVMIRFGGSQLPEGCSWLQFAAVAVLCGVGFTMSLFIGSLAFEGAGAAYAAQVKIGVLLGSVASATLAVLLFVRSTPAR